uniref:Uncharacterized protein n=1 Tax=Ananas comosus var. bracteatus TaxID=296719 RepID=A0A6V7PFZ1_ANACO|nr:unnamed protein product [Ananas comosus var. bracteatus]
MGSGTGTASGLYRYQEQFSAYPRLGFARTVFGTGTLFVYRHAVQTANCLFFRLDRGRIFNPSWFLVWFGASKEGARRVVDTFVSANERLRGVPTDIYVCLPLCLFAHACETRMCEIGRRNGMPWGRSFLGWEC